ncbi:MAG TPA: M20/M25/M40 family metallo-hydrolase [Gaiellales bacterium]|nr:M20/M25/M40 family metallo-hydrolase [Gaiellales bacterium]
MSAVHDALDDLLALARVPAPTFDEGERIEWLRRRLADAPGTRVTDSAGSLIWRFGEGRPRVLLLAHVDTVFARELAHEPVLEDGRLRGPGVGDNAAAVVCAVAVVEEMARERSVEGLAVAFTVGEEGLGNLAGSRAACAELRPELALALEGHGLMHVAVDAVGSLRARICVDGPGGHSWANRGRPSAIDEVCRIARALSRPPRREASTNIGRIEGGTTVNAIAARAELVIEQRALDEAILTRFARALRTLAVEPPLTLEVEVLGRRPAARLDRRQPLLATVRRVRERLGLPDELVAASTDANAALAAGIPALCLGCAQGGEMHTPEEYIDVASLAAGREQLRSVLAELLWENPRP